MPIARRLCFLYNLTLKEVAVSDPLLFLLGAPRLEHDHKPLQLDTRKALALIAYLAITRTAHSRDALATLLWEDYDQAHARAALRRTLSVLNAALNGEYLEVERESIGIAPRARLIVDVNEFGKRIADCDRHGHVPSEVCPRCITPLSEAAALYRSDFMTGFTLRDSPAFDEWQFFQTEELRRQLAGALERLVRFHAEHSEFDLGITHARRWLALDPLHEPAHRHLMQLYAASGQRAAALRQYQECARILKEELGVQPLEETTRIFQLINSGEWVGSNEPTPSSTHLTAASLHYPLVGRDAELQALKNAHAALRTDGYCIILEGEVGVGKTRLAEAFLLNAQVRRSFTISARCYEGGSNLAYGPFIEALRAALADSERANRLKHLAPHFLGEAARLLPELSTLQPLLLQLPPLNSPGAQARFFEGITQTLLALASGRSKGILFIDDLQWADAASIDLLAFLIQRLRGRPLFLLGTWRGEQIPANHRLRQVLTEAERLGLANRLYLSRLDQQSVYELVQAVGPARREFAERLYRETEGLPFFITEYLSVVEQTGEWSLPGGVKNLLRSRLSAVSETGAQVLAAAATIGRSFDFDTLRDASGRTEEEVVVALEELVALGLIREVGAALGDRSPGYDFSHEKLRALVIDGTSHARRRLLHRRIAGSLVKRARLPRDRDALASQIALHFRQAGDGDRAAEYFWLAAEHARRLYANAEALEHFQAALELHYARPALVREALGDLYTLKGDYTQALNQYDAAAADCDAPTAVLEHKRASLHDRRGEWKLAETHFLAASRAERTTSECARIHADWSLSAHHQGDHARARDLAQRSLALADEADDMRARAQAHNILGILANDAGDSDRARAHLEQSVAFAEALNDPGMRAAALNNLALTMSARGDSEQALILTQTALDLCVSVGDRHRAAALHNHLADLYHSLGQSDPAMSHLKQAVTILSEIGVEKGDWKPEIWKLVEW